MAGNKIIRSTKDIALIAIMTTILFVQEQLLINLPNIQLTVFLMVLYSKKFGLGKSVIIIILYTLLDNLYMGSFSIMYTPAMLVGWLLIPLTLCTLFKKVNNSIVLALLGVLYSFIYCWLYVVPNYLIMNIDPVAYIIADIVFEVVLAVCSFVTILLLYKPCSKIIDLMLQIDIEDN